MLAGAEGEAPGPEPGWPGLPGLPGAGIEELAPEPGPPGPPVAGCSVEAAGLGATEDEPPALPPAPEPLPEHLSALSSTFLHWVMESLSLV